MIQALIPLIPLITKGMDMYQASKDKKAKSKAKPTTGVTEIGQAGYIAVLVSIGTTLFNCPTGLSLASMACVSGEQWTALAGVIALVFARARAKAKDL